MEKRNQKTLIIILLLGLNAAFLAQLNAQSCYVRLFDASGIEPTQYQLTALETAACRLRDSLPTAFQNSFKVYDFGFYLQNENMVGGYPEMFQTAITQVETQSQYYLLFGKQTDKTGIYTKFWYALKMPTTAQFSCMIDLQREVYKKRVETKTNKKYAENQNAYFKYHEAEISGIEELIKIINEIKDCCVANRNGVAERSAGCDGCSDELLAEYFKLQNFQEKSVSTDLGTLSDIQTSNLKEITNVRIRTGIGSKLVSDLLAEYVTAISTNIGLKVLVTSSSSVCEMSVENLTPFLKQSEFSCWINFKNSTSVSSGMSVKLEWNVDKKLVVQNQEQANGILNTLYCQIYSLLKVEGYNCIGEFGDNIEYNLFNISTNPNAKDISWFIEELRKEEDRALPLADRTNTKLMITKMRKIFYNTPGWDNYLIPGAANISSPYNVVKVTYPGYPKFWSSGIMLAGDHAGDTETGFFFTDIEHRPIDNTNTTPAIYWNNSQEIKLNCCPDNVMVDIGHVLAGLDAMLHEQQVDPPFGLFIISTNVTAVTWIGDLGSAIAETQYESDQSHNLYGVAITPEKEQAVVDRLAPPADLLGNIDAYVIAAKYPAIYSGGQRLSDILQDYYIGAGQVHQSRRFHIYAEQLGLGWDGAEFSNLPQKMPTYIDDVQNAAALFVLIGAKNIEGNAVEIGINLTNATSTAIALTLNGSAKTHLIKYFEIIKSLISQEN
ncbi:MAG: hypothetical protein RIR11_2696 [Bacteroidota bacterium]